MTNIREGAAGQHLVLRDRYVLASYDVLISYRIYDLLNVLFCLGFTGQSNVHAEVYKCSLHSLHQAKR